MKNLLDYILALHIGLMLTPSAIEYADTWRGYKAFGGEYLIVPVLILAVYIWHSLRDIKNSAPSQNDTE